MGRFTFANLFSKKENSVLGIDFGTENIKLSEISWQNKHASLQAFGIAELPEGAFEDGKVINKQKLSEALNKLVAASGVVSRNSVVTVSGRTVFAREVVFPSMNEAELREAIKWDIEKYVPYTADSVYFDFGILDRNIFDLQNEIKVLLVAAPRETVEAAVEVQKLAGLNPLAVDIEPLALYRTLTSENNIIILDIGAIGTQMILFQKGKPVAIRSIPIAGQRFTEVIMKELDLDGKEAERFKLRQKGLLQGVGSTDLSDMHRQLALVVNEMAREVRRTVDYYQMQNKDMSIEKILLTGGGASMENLRQHLATQLDMAVGLLDPLASVSVSRKIDKTALETVTPQLAVAIGLALRGGDEL